MAIKAKNSAHLAWMEKAIVKINNRRLRYKMGSNEMINKTIAIRFDIIDPICNCQGYSMLNQEQCDKNPYLGEVKVLAISC